MKTTTPGTYTDATHRLRHRDLHDGLMELVRDYLWYRVGLPVEVDPKHPFLRDPMYALLDWSAEQCRHPATRDTPGCHLLDPPKPMVDEPPAIEARPPAYTHVSRPPEGVRVWWLQRHGDGRHRPGLPVPATIVGRSANRVKIRVESGGREVWVPESRLRQRPPDDPQPERS